MNNKYIHPDWSNSILNVSSTLASFLGVDNGKPRIQVLEKELQKNYRNVVFLIFDGLGVNVLENHLIEDDFLLKHNKQSITSVFPCTTTAATRTLMSATPPAEHGWFGWCIYFKKHSRAIELFSGKDFYTNEQVIESNFATKLFPVNAFYLDPNVRKDITIHTCFPKFVDVGHAKQNHTVNDLSELFPQIKSICERDGKKFIYSYMSEPDSAMHRCGVSSNEAKTIVQNINNGLEELSKQCPDTLFIVTADHGHIDIADSIEIYNDKELTECLEEPISLETRFACFKIKNGMKTKFKKLFKKYSADFELFRTSDLIAKCVFGEFKDITYKKYLGDYIAIGKETNKMISFFDGMNENRGKYVFKGCHTGMTKDEMLVPLVVFGNKEDGK